jgi:hypothetical protein
VSVPLERDAELFALDPATCMTLLSTQPVGRLVLGGSDPNVIPVNFVVVGDGVAFRTATDGAAAAADGDAVLFEVDMFDGRTRSGWSVLVRGRLTATERPLGDVPTWAPGARERSMLVTIETVTGRLLRGSVEAPDHPPGGYL